MAWSPWPVKAAGDLFDLTVYNIGKDNFDASAPGVAAVKGDLFGATGVNAIARLAAGANDSILVADSGEATGLAWQMTPAVRLSNSVNIDPAPATWVALTFDTETYDTDELHSLVTNTGRITIPANADGIYLIGGNVEFNSALGAGHAEFGIEIRLNGATVICREFANPNRTGSDISIDIDGPYLLAATDYIELLAYTEKDLDVQATPVYSPVFWAQWMRRP